MTIPIGFTSNVEGSVTKEVHCEKCGGDYVYLTRRKASGSSFSPSFDASAATAADARAIQRLNRELDKAIDPVPCIHCGWLQSAMVIEARRRYHRWAFISGAAMVFLGLMMVVLASAHSAMADLPGAMPDAGIYSVEFIWGGSIGAVLGVALILARRHMASRYDPNESDVERWAELAEDNVMARDEWESLLRKQRQEQQGATRRARPSTLRR